MAAIIKETPSIKEAVTYINTIDLNKFTRLLSRILQKLHLKVERSFSEEEEQKLQSALSMEKQTLTLILETVSFILEQAVYHNIKPASFRQQLEAVHVAPDKAEAFFQAWTMAGPDMIEKIRQRIFAPNKLEHIGWQLSLQMAQSTQAKLKSPHAVLELGVRNEDAEVHNGSDDYLSLLKATGILQVFLLARGTLLLGTMWLCQENVFVEFSHQELLEFYNKLEMIQVQLDSLT